MPEEIDGDLTPEVEADDVETVETVDDNDEKLISQKELDRILAKRLKRQEEQLKKQYSDYDKLKEAAAEYEKIQDEKATDAQRWEKEREKLLASLNEKDQALTKLQRANLIADLAADAKLPKSFWKRVQGDTEEEITEDIASIVKDLGLDEARESKEKTLKTERKPAFGGGGKAEDPDPNTDEIVAKIPRGPQIRVDNSR